jgi:hypothetical protein
MCHFLQFQPYHAVLLNESKTIVNTYTSSHNLRQHCFGAGTVSQVVC